MPSGLRFVQWNACSVYPKLDELRFIMSDPLRVADVLGITETWLNSSCAHSSTEIDGYNHERRDISGGRGGGVAVYIRDEIPYSRRTDLENEHLEDLWIEIKCPRSKGILTGTIYRPPDNASHTITTWCASMQQTLESAQDEDKEIIVIGDINIHFEGGVSYNDQWQAVVDSLQLTQVITSPTRVTATTETLIDHIYTTHPQHVRASKVGLLSASDHFPVIMIRKWNYARVDTPSVITYRSFKYFHRNNFIYDLLQIPWSEVVKHDNVDDALSAWMAIFADMCDKHAPVKRRKVKRKQQSAWLSGEIVAAMQVRENTSHMVDGNITGYGEIT